MKTYILPAYWASYLINGDDSGISDTDKKNADFFLEYNNLGLPLSCSEESFFKWGNDFDTMGGDVLEYTFP